MSEYNLEILTFIMFGMVTFSAVFYNGLSLVQKMMLVYMFLFTLHEWEETRFPGGFAKLMLKFFKLKTTPNQIHAAHIPVTILLIIITFVPFFTQYTLLALVPVYLGLFETFIHIIGIKLHKMEKPYTPGLITAMCLGLTSIISLLNLSNNNLLQSWDYVWGILIMFLCFGAMQRTVIAIYGLGYKDLIANLKNNQ